MKNRQVILVERYWYGHSPTYCKLLASAVLRAGERLTLLCPHPDEVREYLRAQGLSLELLEAHAVPRFEGPLHAIGFSSVHAQSYMEPVFSFLEQHPAMRSKDNLLYVSVADLLFDAPLAVRAISRRLAMPWGGLYMQPLPRSLAAFPRRKTRLLARLWPYLSGKGPDFMTSLDAELLEQSPMGKGRKILPFPDVTDESPPDPEHPLARELKAFAKGRPVVGLLGNIAPWKGAHSFLDCVENWGSEHEACFALCGPLVGSEKEQAAIRERVERCQKSGRPLFVRWGRIEDGVAYNSLFAELDLFWAHYPGHCHSSNNLTKAAMLQVPVVCGTHGLMGERVKHYGLGQTFRFSKPEESAEAALACLHKSPANTAGMRDYFAANSQAALDRVVERILNNA